MQKQILTSSASGGRTKVLIIDDSALIRSLLTEIINRQPDMVVVGAAPDPIVAREMIRNLNPDVLTLDVEMPRMDGIDFLEKLMRLRPMPVVMVSTMTQKGADTTLRALELGAVDFVAKPKLDVTKGMLAGGGEIIEKVRLAATACVRKSAAPTTSRSSCPTWPPVARCPTWPIPSSWRCAGPISSRWARSARARPPPAHGR